MKKAALMEKENMSDTEMRLEEIGDPCSDKRFPLHWQMTRSERLAMISILGRIRPQLALEIGTYLGGSLQVISHFSEQVISLEYDPTVAERLSMFKNCEFIVGDSRRTLPLLVKRLNDSGNTPDFVLLDANHSEEYVRGDINNLLQIVPKRDMLILCHDSFNPDCRRGMLGAGWAQCPYVHSVEIDLIPGLFHANAATRPGDTAKARSMWGGLACALLRPTVRDGDLVVRESEGAVFNAIYDISSHKIIPPGRIKAGINRLCDLGANAKISYVSTRRRLVAGIRRRFFS